MVEALRCLELAVPAPPETDPLDAAMTELSLAGINAMRGRFDIARPLFEPALARVSSPPAGRAVDVAEHLASLALVGALHQDFAFVHTLADRLRTLSNAQSDSCSPTTVGLIAEAVGCFADLTSTEPAQSVNRATAIYHQAQEAGVLLAAWICCIIHTELAIPLGKPGVGLTWFDRMTDVQLRLGAQPEAMPLEGRATLLWANKRHREAVALFAASKVQSRRAGIGWPVQDTTDQHLREARSHLGLATFEAAWNEGLAMTATQAIGTDSTANDWA
jgi:hypothetical protein